MALTASYPADQAGRQQLAAELAAKGLKPTQTKQHFDRDKINAMADAMKDGSFDWNNFTLQDRHGLSCPLTSLLPQPHHPAAEAVARLHDPDPLARQRIVSGIAHNVTQHERARHALFHALLDSDPDVRRSAAAYCSQYIFLSWGNQALAAPLRQALGDDDPQVRAGAANALRHLRRPCPRWWPSCTTSCGRRSTTTSAPPPPRPWGASRWTTRPC